MLKFVRSSVNPLWFEVQEDGRVIQEIAIAFRIRKIPSFAVLEDALAWLQATEMRLAKWHAHRLLSLRSYPSRSLLEKLRLKGFSSAVCEPIVSELERIGLIEDSAWELREIERELRAGHGPRYIEAKWKAKGLPIERVRQVITDEQQRECVQQLWSKLSRQKKGERQKVVQALLRRGFDFAVVGSVSRCS